jgi:hypothetical protein
MKHEKNTKKKKRKEKKRKRKEMREEYGIEKKKTIVPVLP